MRDQKTLVIVEVRYRSSASHGGASISITPSKQRRIISATRYYLSQHPWPGPIRFDVIAITGEQWEWLKNAWWCSD